jgi:hypothetical protein
VNVKQFRLWAGVAILGLSSLSTQAATIGLFDYGFNIDGATGTTLSGVDLSGFDTITGLGNIGVTITGVGTHSFDAFFDHEIDEATNTFFNEYGAVSGVAAAGQSWEIDEPGYLFGDIYDNFLLSTLDNTNAIPMALPDDVSMAMGWDFVLNVGETALIDLVLSNTDPGTGFYLTHTDPDSNASVYLSSSLRITAAPEPSVVLLFGLGLMGIGVSRRLRGQG